MFALSLAAYGLTLQRDVLPADSGEFQLAAAVLDVAHPPGYPLYTMAGKLFTLLTAWHPALGLNLMSAVLAAATLALLFASVRRIAGGLAGTWGALAAVLALGSSTTFWAQATIANIRMPTLFFLAWCLYELPTFHLPLATFHSSLPRLALALSLGIGHHPSLAFIGLFVVLYLVLLDPALAWSPRRWAAPLAAFALGQLAWLYLPIRAAAGGTVLAAENLTTLEGFVFHALARGFGGDMFAFASPTYLPVRAALLPVLFAFQFNPALLAASAWGALVVAWRDWRLAVLLLGGWLLHVFVTITYRAPQTVEYMMPAYVLQVVALGLGVSQLVAWSRAAFSVSAPGGLPARMLWAGGWPARLSAVLAGGVLLAGLLNGAAHAPGYAQLAGDHSTREYVTPILEGAPPGALILSDWHWAMPMLYLQIVEGLRPDVEVEYVYPVSGVEYDLRWLQRIEQEIARRPVIVTRYAAIPYAASPYVFHPLGRAFRVYDQAPHALPQDFVPASLDFEKQVGIAGYRFDRTTFRAGQAVELALAWQPLATLAHDYSFTVHVLDANGRHVAQRDRALLARPYAPGEVHVERFVLPLAIDWRPGAYQVVVGVYYALPEGGWHNLEAGGQTLAALAEMVLEPTADPPFTLHPMDTSFGNGVRLVGVDYDCSDPGALRVVLHWYAQAALAQPASLNVRVQAGAVLDERPLPALPVGAYVSTAHDLAGWTGGGPTLALLGPDGPLESTGAWGLAQSSLALPAPAPGARYVWMGDQLILVGVSSGQATLRAGDEMRLDLAFVARRSLVSDDSISVRLVSAAGWLAHDDTQPVQGALPTLKWIAGSRVIDPHWLVLPADAEPGWLEARLVAYDAFRQASLLPLDNRLGEELPLGRWEIVE